jgi:peptide/nickel transport system permease protein
MGTLKPILGRLVQALLTLLVLSMIVFALSRATGNPALILLPPSASTDDVRLMEAHLGLDKPLHVQYWTYLAGLLQGDFGRSVRTGELVSDLLLSRVGGSLLLACVALFASIVIAIPLGIVAALRPGGWLDGAIRAVSSLGLAVPPFWLGILLVLLFSVWWRILPSSGFSGPLSILLPAAVLVSEIVPGLVRLMRGAMLEVLSEEYVVGARAKGLSPARVLWRHAFPNALITIITYLGLVFSALVASAVVVESIFIWPGLGRLSYEALLARDVAVIQGAVLLWGAIVIAVNFLADLAYVAIDPRVRVS